MARTPKRKVSRTAAARRSARVRSGRRVVVLVATRKGAWIYHGDAARKSWRADGPHFLGHIIQHVVLDPRDGRTLLAAAKTGHLGPTVFRSTDFGRNWKEAAKPPAFAKAPEAQKGRAVDHTFWLTPCHANEPDAWYAGTSPQGMFRSDDGGVTWEPLPGLNDNAQYRTYMGDEQGGTPDGPKLHSVIVDPRNSAHLYMAMSSGGVHESRDKGRTWTPLVQNGGGGELGPRQHRLPRSALRAALPEQPGPALPAEPLRDLSARPAVYHLDPNREEHAGEGRRHWIPDGAPPARCGHGLGVPHGRDAGLAAHQPGRHPIRLRDAQRRRGLEAAHLRAA